jgi:hypothetical protein
MLALIMCFLLVLAAHGHQDRDGAGASGISLSHPHAECAAPADAEDRRRLVRPRFLKVICIHEKCRMCARPPCGKCWSLSCPNSHYRDGWRNRRYRNKFPRPDLRLRHRNQEAGAEGNAEERVGMRRFISWLSSWGATLRIKYFPGDLCEPFHPEDYEEADEPS